MKHKEIVVRLIVESTRFRQYAAVLQKLGVDTSYLEPDLMDIIAKLLDINMSDAWGELYVSEINKSTYLPIERMGENLGPLAEVCYRVLSGAKIKDDVVHACK